MGFHCIKSVLSPFYCATKKSSKLLKIYVYVTLPLNSLFHPVKYISKTALQHIVHTIHFSDKSICHCSPYSLNSNSVSLFILTTKSSTIHFHIPWLEGKVGSRVYLCLISIEHLIQMFIFNPQPFHYSLIFPYEQQSTPSPSHTQT